MEICVLQLQEIFFNYFFPQSIFTILFRQILDLRTVFNFLNFFFLMYLFIFGCVGSSLLRRGFLQLWRAGATLRRGARASHFSGFSCCGAQALGTRASVVVVRGLQWLWLEGFRAQAQWLWRTGLVALRHVGSSWTRDQTHVPCIGRQILNHCPTREVPNFLNFFIVLLSEIFLRFSNPFINVLKF